MYNGVMSNKKRISPEVSAYMARIGRKGAKSLHAGSTPEERSKRCQRAAQARWKQYRERKKTEREDKLFIFFPSRKAVEARWKENKEKENE